MRIFSPKNAESVIMAELFLFGFLGQRSQVAETGGLNQNSIFRTENSRFSRFFRVCVEKIEFSGVFRPENMKKKERYFCISKSKNSNFQYFYREKSRFLAIFE